VAIADEVSVDPPDHLESRWRLRAHDDAVWAHEVVDGTTLLEELWVGDNLDGEVDP
jgi:hypothetical protein